MTQKQNLNIDEDDILMKERDGSFRVLSDGKVMTLDEYDAYRKQKKDSVHEIDANVLHEKIEHNEKVQKKDIESTPVVASSKMDVAKKIVDASGVNLDAAMKPRLLSLLENRFKGNIRNFDIKKQLSLPQQKNGFGMDQSQIKKLLSLVNQELQGEINTDGVKQPPQPAKLPASMPASPQMKKPENSNASSASKAQELTQKILKDLDSKNSRQQEVMKKAFSKPMVHNEMKVKPQELVKEAPKPIQPVVEKNMEAVEAVANPEPKLKPEMPQPAQPPKEMQAQPVVEKKMQPEVSKPPVASQPARNPDRLKSPVEEMEYSLIDYRRIAADPVSANQKILKRLQLLAEESFKNKILSIQAFHRSQIFLEYMKITRTSLEQGKPVSEVMQDMGGQSLNAAEYDAILMLSDSMRFYR